MNINHTYRELKELNHALMSTLLNSEKEDGLFAPYPLDNDEDNSLTNTGIVLQAYLEYSYIDKKGLFYAQQLSKKTFNFLINSNSYLFPNLEGNLPHIVSNSCCVLGILNCQPHQINDSLLKQNLNWFLNNQNQDGSWDLIPKKKSASRSFWTAFSLATLLKYNQCLNLANDKSNQAQITKALQNGAKYLINSRPIAAKDMDLLLWSNGNNLYSKELSFAVSTFCLNSLLKIDVLHQEKMDYHDQMIKTFHWILDGFTNGNNINNEQLLIGQIKLDIWGTVSEGAYNWKIFAPISLIPMLRFFGTGKEKKLELNKTIDYFLKEINRYIMHHNNHVWVNEGIHGHKAATWATAQTVIIISRILRNYHLMNEDDDKKVEIDKFELAMKHIADKRIHFYTNIFFYTLLIVFLCISGYVINTYWPIVEPMITYLSIGVSAIAAVAGLTSREYFRDKKIHQFIVKISDRKRKKMLKKIMEIYSKN